MDDRSERFEHFVIDVDVQRIRQIDLEALEHHPVQLRPLADVRASVQLVRVVEVDQHLPGRHSAAFDLLGGLLQSCSQPGLLVANLTNLLGQFLSRPVRVRSQLDVSVLLPIELGKSLLQARFTHLVVAAFPRDRIIDAFDDFAPQLRSHADGVVVVCDGLLQQDGPDIGQVAEPVLATAADVIEVQVTSLALAAGDDHPSVAATAEQHPLEVVVVAALTVARSGHDGQHVLNPVPQVLRYERLVPPFVFSAVPGHPTEVVAVAQHRLHGVLGDGAGREVTRRAAAETRFCKAFAELFVGVLARREPLESHRDERSAVRIERDRVDHAAFEVLADVEVARRDITRGASHDRLLGHLVLQVLAARRGLKAADRKHDALHHLALGRPVIDLLGGRKDTDAETAQLHHHHTGFGPVAMEARE